MYYSPTTPIRYLFPSSCHLLNYAQKISRLNLKPFPLTSISARIVLFLHKKCERAGWKESDRAMTGAPSKPERLWAGSFSDRWKEKRNNRILSLRHLKWRYSQHFHLRMNRWSSMFWAWFIIGTKDLYLSGYVTIILPVFLYSRYIISQFLLLQTEWIFAKYTNDASGNGVILSSLSF